MVGHYDKYAIDQGGGGGILNYHYIVVIAVDYIVHG